jgi:hypothetical protein
MDDPFAGVPIDYNRIDPPVYQGTEFDTFINALQAKLKETDV